MFTGLVEEVGTIRSDRARGRRGARVDHRAPRLVLDDVEMGASIAVNGCCLTVVEWGDDWWAADAVPETMDRTNLGGLQPKAIPSTSSGRWRPTAATAATWCRATSTAPGRSSRHRPSSTTARTATRSRSRPSSPTYVVEKGSIAVDGISLTVAGVTPTSFSIAIIPHTHAVTAMGRRQVGDTVNLEADVLAKYVERLVRPSL